MRNNSLKIIERGSVILERIPSYIIKDGIIKKHADSEVLFNHADSFNSIILSNRLVAKETISPEEDITVSFSQFLYAWFNTLSIKKKQQMYVYAEDSVRIAALKDGFLPECCDSNIKVDTYEDDQGCQRTVVTKRSFECGEIIFRESGIVTLFPLVNTIALSEGKHLRLSGGPEFLEHSCQHSVNISFDGENIIGTALRRIFPNERLTYNYMTTEWEITLPFKCNCKESSCYGIIRGFKYLGNEEQTKLSSSVSKAVFTKWKLIPQSFNESSFSVFRIILGNNHGNICVMEDIKRSEILFTFNFFIIEKDLLVVDNVRIRHSNKANGIVIEGKIIARCDIRKGTEVTVNLKLLAYSFPPFKDEDGTNVCGFCDFSEEDRNRFIMYVDPSIRAEAVLNSAVIHSSSPLVTIKAIEGMGQTTIAAQIITKETKIFNITGLCLPFPTMYTIHLGNGKHLLFGDGAQCLAHSCDPNVRIDVNVESESIEVVALNDIKPEDIIAFNFLTTEWDMNQPFPCLCGSDDCFRMIRGYKHLTPEQKVSLNHLVTSSIKELTLNGDFSLPPTLRMQGSLIQSTSVIPLGSVLFPCTQFIVEHNHIELFGLIIPHNPHANTVLVEGFLVTNRRILNLEFLSVNMCYFIYDMEALFPTSSKLSCRGFKHLKDFEQQSCLYLCEPPVRAHAMLQGFVVSSPNDAIIVCPYKGMGQTAFATRTIPKDTVIFHASGLTLPYPTMYTVCVGLDKHLLFGGAGECLAHNCEPNVRIVVLKDSTFNMVTISTVLSGEQL